MAKRKTVTICYKNYAGKQFEHSFTGTQEEIDAEVDRICAINRIADITGCTKEQAAWSILTFIDSDPGPYPSG